MSSYELIPEFEDDHFLCKAASMQKLQIVEKKPTLEFSLGPKSYKLDKAPDKNFIVLGSFYQCDIPLYHYPRKKIKVHVPRNISYDLYVQMDARSRLSRIESTSYAALKRGHLFSASFSLPAVREKISSHHQVKDDIFLQEHISFDCSSSDPIESTPEIENEGSLETDVNITSSRLLKQCRSFNCTSESWENLFVFEQNVYFNKLCKLIKLRLTSSSFLSEVDKIKNLYASKCKSFFKDALESFREQENIILRYLEFITEFEIYPFEEIFTSWVSFISFSHRKKNSTKLQADAKASLLLPFFNFCKKKISFSCFSTLFGLFSTLFKEKEQNLIENGNLRGLFFEISDFVNRFLTEYGYLQRAYLISLLYCRVLITNQKINVDDSIDMSILESLQFPNVSTATTIQPSFDPWEYLRDEFLKNKSCPSIEALLNIWLNLESSMNVCPSFCISRSDSSPFSKISFSDDLQPLMISAFDGSPNPLDCVDFAMKERVILDQLTFCGLNLYDHASDRTELVEGPFLTTDTISLFKEFCRGKESTMQGYWEELCAKRTARCRFLVNVFRKHLFYSPLSFNYGAFRFTVLQVSSKSCNKQALNISVAFILELALAYLREQHYLAFAFWICLYHDILYQISDHDRAVVMNSFFQYVSYLDVPCDSGSPLYLEMVRSKLLLRCYSNFFAPTLDSLLECSDLTSQIYSSINEDLFYLFLSIKIKKAHCIGELANASFLNSILGILFPSL